MRTWRAGDLMVVAAGITMLFGAFAPWVVVEPGTGYGGAALGLWGPLAAAVLTGAALVAAGLGRTLWSGLVGLSSALATGIIVLMIAESGAAIGVPGGHATGFGLSAMVAAALLGALGGIVTSVQREPPITTRAVHQTPR